MEKFVKPGLKTYQEIIVALKDNAKLAKKIAKESYVLVLLLEDYRKESMPTNGSGKKTII